MKKLIVVCILVLFCFPLIAQTLNQGTNESQFFAPGKDVLYLFYKMGLNSGDTANMQKTFGMLKDMMAEKGIILTQDEQYKARVYLQVLISENQINMKISGESFFFALPQYDNPRVFAYSFAAFLEEYTSCIAYD